MYDGVDGGVAAGESPYTLKDIFRIVWKRLWLIVLMPLVCVGAAVGFSLSQTPVYEASSELVVTQRPPDSDQQLPMGANVEGLSQLTQTMVEAIPSRPVAEQIIEKQNLNTTPDALLENLTVEQVESTTLLIGLSYRSTDPEEAQRIANAVGDVASERISELTAGSANVQVSVWEPAVVPAVAVSPNPPRTALIALAVGLMLGVGLAFLMEHLDDSWRSVEEVERVAGVPTFGSIPAFEAARARKSKGKATT